MTNPFYFLCAPDDPSGAPVPPRFRPGMPISRHRAFYGAMRNARERRDAHWRHTLRLLAVAICAAAAAGAFGIVASPGADAARGAPDRGVHGSPQ